MNVPWEQAKAHLKNLGYPGVGYNGDWDEWYEQSWQHLCDSGLTKVDKPIDLTLVNLRIAALCWLIHDFCASVEGNECVAVPCWSDWINELEIDPVVAALLLRSRGQALHLLSEASLTDPTPLMEHEEGIWLLEVGGIQKKLWPQVIMNAVFQQRERIFNALFVGFDGLIPLFESMFACIEECDFYFASQRQQRGYLWLEECCRVLIAGAPEVELPHNSIEGSDGGL